MNHHVTQDVRGPLARIGLARRRYRRRVQLRPDPGGQLAEHPGAFLTQRNSARRRDGFPIRRWSPFLHEPAAGLRQRPAGLRGFRDG